jgi:hypothetical protein
MKMAFLLAKMRPPIEEITHLMFVLFLYGMYIQPPSEPS